MSKGNIASSYPAKHVINIHIDRAKAVGLGSTNMTDFKVLLGSQNFMKRAEPNFSYNPITTTVFDYISYLATTYEAVTPVVYKYKKFNKATSTYSNVTIAFSTIISLIKYHEKEKEDGTSTPETNRKIIRDIQNSLHGGIVALDNDDKVIVKIIFKPGNKSYGRVPAKTSLPIIADVPRTPAGTPFSPGKSSDYQQKLVDGEDENIGVYIKPNTEANTPEKDDIVAGKLALTYDDATGTWSVQNQMMAIALDDIPAANVSLAPEALSIANGSVTPRDALQGSQAENPLKNYVGFTTGRAMPVYPHKGNPHFYGPKFFKCDDVATTEVVRVVNRFPKGIAKGTLLMLHKINGEWIPTILDSTDIKPIVKAKWEIHQFVANSDCFFKDYRYYDGKLPSTNSIDNGAIIGDSDYQDTITSSKYIEQVRAYYYDYGGDDFKKGNNNPYSKQLDPETRTVALGSIYEGLNIKTGNFLISDLYLQVSNFFFVDAYLGGIGSKTLYSQTNVLAPDAYYDNFRGYDEGQYTYPFIFGCTFPDGYTADSTSKLTNAVNGVNYTIVGSLSHYFGGATLDLLSTVAGGQGYLPTSTEGFLALSATPTTDQSLISIEDGKVLDTNFYQLPADIGCHASPDGENGSPITDFSSLTGVANYSVLEQMLDNRSCLLSSDEGVDEIYDFRPVNPKLITFNCLQPELLAADKTSLHNALSEAEGAPIRYNVGDIAYQIDFDPLASVGSDWTGVNLYKRARTFINHTANIWPGFINDYWQRNTVAAAIGEDYTDDDDDSPPAVYSGGLQDILPICKPLASEYPYATATPWDIPNTYDPGKKRFNPWADGDGNGGSFTVGIIGAKTTVSSDGVIGFQTFQNIGLGGYKFGSFVSSTPFSTGGISFITAGYGTITVTKDASTILQYGGQDRENSFGSANLFVQCYDAWPADQTIFDSRYNAVMHFNPKQDTSLAPLELIHEGIDEPDYGQIYDGNFVKPWERQKDRIRSPVEYRVPTEGGGAGYSEMAEGTLVNGQTKMYPEDEWIVKTDRNRKLLPYFYYKTVIGANNNTASIKNRGEDVKVDDILSGAKNTKIKVTNVTDDGELATGGFIWLDYGEGFLPTDFADSSIYDINFDKGVVIGISSAKVWERPMIDKGPAKQFDSTRISSPSNRGQTAGAQGKQSNLTIPNPNASKLYDLFFFFQNDIAVSPLWSHLNGYGPHFITVEIQ